MAFQVAIMLRANERLQVRRADLRRIVHFVEVSFAIGHQDQLGLGHAPGRSRGRLQRLHPPHAFLLINGPGIAAPIGFQRLRRAGPAPGLEHTQGDAVGPVSQQAVEPQPLSLLFSQRPQAGGLAQSAVVQAGRVLGQQDDRLGRHASLGRLAVRLQKRFQTEGGAPIFNETVSSFGRSPILKAAAKTGLRLFPTRLQNRLRSPMQTLISQLPLSQFLRTPLFLRQTLQKTAVAKRSDDTAFAPHRESFLVQKRRRTMELKDETGHFATSSALPTQSMFTTKPPH